MRKHITWLLAAGLLLSGSAAYAQTAPQKPAKPGPAARLHIQKRLHDGVRAGQITRPELKQLRQRLTEIRKHGKAMRADGSFSRQEKMKLRREWRQASRALFQKRHNRIK